MKRKSTAITIEVIMFFTYAFFAVNWIAGSTLTPNIMEYFGIEEFAYATFISNAVTLAKIIGNFVAAGIFNRLYPKKSIALGSVLIVLGSLLAVFSPTFWIFIIARFIMGFGGALYVVYFSPTVFEFFTEEQRPTVNAINSVSYNTGSIIALLIVGPVIAHFGTWQKSMLFFTVISGILFVLWLVFGKDYEIVDDMGSQGKYSLAEGIKDAFNWKLAFTYSGLLTLYIVMLNIFPLTDLSAISSKNLSVLFALGGICGTILAIGLSKVYTKRIPVIRYCGLLMTIFGILMLNITNPILSAIIGFLIGVMMFLPMTSLMMIPQELEGMTASRLTVTMGLFWALSYIIETILYFIIGYIVDIKGFEMALYFTMFVSLTFFVGSFLLPKDGESA